MRILALDAAGLECSAALLEDGACIAECRGGNSRLAAAQLPVIVAGLLAEFGAGFDAVAVTVGPGSFTGLRGALALGHGLALGGAVPVVGVTVAEALLHVSEPTLHAPTRVTLDASTWVALDARRPGRIYLDTGQGMGTCSIEELPDISGAVLVVGDAAEAVCAARPLATLGTARTVSAVAVGQVAARRLAGELGPCDARPVYVEAPAAKERSPAWSR